MWPILRHLYSFLDGAKLVFTGTAAMCRKRSILQYVARLPLAQQNGITGSQKTNVCIVQSVYYTVLHSSSFLIIKLNSTCLLFEIEISSLNVISCDDIGFNTEKALTIFSHR